MIIKPSCLSHLLCLLLLFSSSLLIAQQNTRYPPRMEDGKWGIWNDNSDCWAVKPDFDRIKAKEDFFKLYKDRKVGMVPSGFRFELPCEYEDVYFHKEFHLIAVKKEGKWGCIDPEGKVLVDFAYDRLGPLTHDRLLVQNDKKYGLIDYQGKEIAAPSFESIRYDNYRNFYKQRVVVVRQNEKNGLLSLEDGELWLPCQFQWVNPNILISESIAKPKLFPVLKKEQWGYADSSGALVIPYMYEGASSFYKGCAIVRQDGDELLINEQGDMISPRAYRNIAGFDPDNDISKVSLESKENGLINVKGEEVLPPAYSIYQSYRPNRYKNKSWYREQKKREQKQSYTPVKLPKSGPQPDALAPNLFIYQSMDRDSSGVIDASGKEVFPLGRYSFNNKFKWGAFGHGFRNVHQPDLAIFPQDLVIIKQHHKNEYIVKKDDLYGIWDVLSEQLILPCIYDQVQSHMKKNESGLYIAKKEKWGMVNNKNEVVIPFEYKRLYFAGNNRSVVAQKDGKYGLFNAQGDLLQDFEYSKMSPAGYGFFHARKDYLRGILDSNGQLLFPMHNYYDFSGIYLYGKSGLIRNRRDEMISLPDSLQYVTSVLEIEHRRELVINLKGEVIDTIKHRREKKKEPSVYHGIFHGQFQWEVFMEDGSVLYGAEADPEIVEKYKTGRYGFYEKALDYPPFENSYFLMRANKLVSYERIERGGDYQNPLRWVKQDQYFGLINSMGELVVPIECDKVGVFQEGLICLVKDGKLGFVNEKGETVIPFEYDDDYNALPDFAFVNGHSVVYRDKKYGVIDAKGQTKVPCSFDIITYFDGKEVLGFRNGKWELVGW